MDKKTSVLIGRNGLRCPFGRIPTLFIAKSPISRWEPLREGSKSVSTEFLLYVFHHIAGRSKT